MSLLTTLSDANKVVKRGRVVRYAAEPFVWTDSKGVAYNLYWKITRASETQYTYVALTQDAAETGAADLQAELTRLYARWTATLDKSTTPPTPVITETNALVCTSSVQPVLSAGDAWHIEVQQSETDEVIVTEEPQTYADMDALFALALARDKADDGDAVIVITEANWLSASGKIVAYYEVSNIAAFNPALVAVQRKQGDSWVTVPNVTAGAGGVEFPYGQNLGFRINYNSDAVISNYYVTADEPMPALSIPGDTHTYTPGGNVIDIDVQATGSPRALAGIANKGRWTVKVNGRSNSLISLTDLGGGLVRLRFGYYPTTAAYAPNLAVQVIFAGSTSMSPSSSASVTLTAANYVDAQTADLIDASPVSTRVRIEVHSDFELADMSTDYMSVPGYTIERFKYFGDYNSGALVVRLNAQTWQLAAKYLNIAGTIPAPNGSAAPFNAPTVAVKNPLRYVKSMAYFDDTGRTYFTVGVHDISYDSWLPSNMLWQKWTGGEWVTLTIGGSSKNTSTEYQIYFGEDLTETVIQAIEEDDSKSFVYIPSGADYTRIIKAEVVEGALRLTLDWRLDGSVTALDIEKFEAVINDETVPITAIDGDTLVFSSLTLDPGTISVSLIYDSTTTSLPFSFTYTAPES